MVVVGVLEKVVVLKVPRVKEQVLLLEVQAVVQVAVQVVVQEQVLSLEDWAAMNREYLQVDTH